MKHDRKNWLIVPRENWYRDLILFVIAGVLFWSTIVGQNTAQESKRTSAKSEKIAKEAATLAKDDRQLAIRNRKLVLLIQSQRYNTVFDLCWEQNRRHNRTIRSFKRQTRYFTKHPFPGVSKAQIRVSNQGSIELINDLAPRQNCTALASKSIHPNKRRR